MLENFPYIEVNGSCRERGEAHGEHFAERIERVYHYYMDTLFKTSPLSKGDIEQRAAYMRARVSDYDSGLAEEIEGIARASKHAPWQIYALNARTEILNAPVGECTSMAFASEGILAQNWDWAEPLEELAVLIRHRRNDGPDYISFNEPGMVAKVGMNDAGLGVCLNILRTSHPLSGIPTHVLLRALLDARSVTEGQQKVQRAGFGKASNIMFADSSGKAVSVEFTGDATHTITPKDGVIVHTNHCIAEAACGKTTIGPTSVERLEDAHRQLAMTPQRDLALAKEILLSRRDDEGSINVPYHPKESLGGENVGTCATILMDLKAKHFHIKKGPLDLERPSPEGQDAGFWCHQL